MKTTVKTIKTIVMNIKTIVKTMKDYSPDYEDYSKDYERLGALMPGSNFVGVGKIEKIFKN